MSDKYDELTQRARGRTNPWTRKHRVTANFNAGELGDLMLISEAWRCSPALVIWGLVAEWLSALRARDLMCLPYGESSREILLRAREVEGFYADEIEACASSDGVEPAGRCHFCGSERPRLDQGGDGEMRGSEPGPDSEHRDVTGDGGVGHHPGARGETSKTSKVRS